MSYAAEPVEIFFGEQSGDFKGKIFFLRGIEEEKFFFCAELKRKKFFFCAELKGKIIFYRIEQEKNFLHAKKNEKFFFTDVN